MTYAFYIVVDAGYVVFVVGLANEQEFSFHWGAVLGLNLLVFNGIDALALVNGAERLVLVNRRILVLALGIHGKPSLLDPFLL